MKSYRTLGLMAGLSLAAFAAATDAGSAPAKQTAFPPDPTPTRKVNIGSRPAFTSEGFYVRPGEHVDTVDVNPAKWEKVNRVALPGPDMAIERPPGIPEGAIPAAGGLWLVKLENGTYAALGSQTIPDASVSKEEAASELGLPLAATAGAVITDPAPGAVQDASQSDTDPKAAEVARRQSVEDEVNGLTVAKLKEALDKAEVSYEGDANKPTLQKALLAHRLKG